MTVKVKTLLSGKLDQKHGKGVKMLLADVSLIPLAEVLRPSSVDMKSFKMIVPMSMGGLMGSATALVDLVGPGSVGNYASFTCYRITMSGTTYGTLAAKALNATYTIRKTLLIIGD